MSADLFRSILKVSAAQILRAAGFDRARSPAVIDAFADILARYLQLLGSTSQYFAELDNREESDLEDVRAAMEKCGLLRPLDLFSDEFTRQEETAGVDAFIDWARGTKAQELRLVAGMEKQWGADFYGLAEPPTGSGFGHDWLSSKLFHAKAMTNISFNAETD